MNWIQKTNSCKISWQLFVNFCSRINQNVKRHKNDFVSRKRLTLRNSKPLKVNALLNRFVKIDRGAKKKPKKISNKSCLFEKILRFFRKSKIYVQWIVSWDVGHSKSVIFTLFSYNTLKKSNDDRIRER